MVQTPLELRTPSPATDTEPFFASNSEPSLESNARHAALTSDLVHFFAEAGVMKSVVDAERLALQQHPAP
jgi:hypothetical protein